MASFSNKFAAQSNIDTSNQPIRLKYELCIRGRSQPVRIIPKYAKDEQPLYDTDLKAIMPKLHPLDVAIARELCAGSMYGYIGDSQLARLLPLLIQRATKIGNERLSIYDQELFPRVKIIPGPTGGILITMGLGNDEIGWIDIEEGRLIAGSQAYFLRGSYAVSVKCPKPWELTTWSVNPTKNISGELTSKARDELVRELASVGVPASELELLAVRRGAPDRLIARIWVPEEQTREPKARLILEADYSGERVVIGSQRARSHYIKSNISGGLIERDLLIEENARRTLRSLGFKYDRNNSNFIAHKEAALMVLDNTSAAFPANWIIDRSANAPQFHRDLELQAKIQLIEERGLLDLSVNIDAVGEEDTISALIEMKDLLIWLQTGKRYLKLRDGSYVAPSDKFRRGLKILDDLGADGTRALISPLCVGLLRHIGDFAALKSANQATQNWLDELTGSSHPQKIKPPMDLASVLRDYQCLGLDWLAMLHRHQLTGILADDMGLGKTIQTLALLLNVRINEGQKPSLVVAPTSVVTVWRDEADRFAPELSLILYNGTPKVRHAIDISQADLVVTSYGILRRDAERLANHSFRYVILDEAQSAKNAASQNARAVRKLVSEKRLALTGTPIENRPDELWAAFDFLAPGFLGNLRRFRKRYSKPIAQGDEDALNILRARIQPLVLRRLKNEVAKELPPKIESTVRCEMDKAQRALYDHLAGTLKENVMQKIKKVGIEKAQLDVLAALTRLRQVCCEPALLPNVKGFKTPPSAKLLLFEELMREALASERRVLVFSQFVQMQKRLITVIKGLGVTPLWLHGGTRHRDKVIDAFQTPSGPPVIVVSLRAGGTGLTLTRADTVMHYDPWWNPAVERQATDRTHRLGQKHRVTVYKLICADTIEEKVLALAQRKEKLADSLISSEGGSGAKLISREEVLALIEG